MKKRNYNLEFKLFFRNPAAWTGIIILLLTGFTGLYLGKTFIEQQKAVIAKAKTLQKKNTLNNIEHFGNDTGLFFYHNKFSTANTPDRWAAFANGQRDINPYLTSVTMLGLEGQLYDTEIANPVSLLFGNLDLSFVFIFLFPLVIIAFTYNLISEQKETGIWPVLRAQTDALNRLIRQKFLVRVITVYAVAATLLLAAVFYLRLPVDLRLLLAFVLIFFYLAFWFAAAFFLISLGKSSNYNASAFIAFWVFICIVVPASLNLYLSYQYPVPEALQNVIRQREGYHEKWDMAKEVTMKPFFKHYPQLAQYPFPKDKSFSWFWYYAMQQMGDDQALDSRNAVARKLDTRERFTNLVAGFFPTVQLQLGINEIAATDLASHLNFQQHVRNYHERIRLHFYPAIFLNHKVTDTDVERFNLKTYKSPLKTDTLFRIFSLSLTIVILLILSWRNFESEKYSRNFQPAKG